MSFQLAKFSQSAFLRNVADPEIRGGVCVALCDIWLKSILDNPKVEPPHRMAFMASAMASAMSHQKTYQSLRSGIGRDDARRVMGQQVGIDYDAQTTVMRIHVGQRGMLDRLAADLALPGASATWSMRFQAGGGHALAGTNGLVSITPTMHRMSLHVFDPNVGEYAGTIQDLPSILGDLFQRFPLYLTVTEVHRTRAGASGNP